MREELGTARRVVVKVSGDQRLLGAPAGVLAWERVRERWAPGRA